MTAIPEGRSGQKRRAIMDAAADVFLQKGYLGTSMDEVAARAAVSKQTVYKHFADKDGLFTEVFMATVEQAHTAFDTILETLEATEDVEHDLRVLARELMAAVIRPRMLQLRRIVIGEADRFPDLARTWYEQGPERTAAALAIRFKALGDQRRLRVDDPYIAGHHFNWLVLSIPLNRLTFCVRDDPFTPADLERFAVEGARAFYAAYRAD